jgi:hypothetical protein
MSSNINYAGPGSNVNRDPVTKIRYGVLPTHRAFYWYDIAEPECKPPICPNCNSQLVDYDDETHAGYKAYRSYHCFEELVCVPCETWFDASYVGDDDFCAYVVSGNGYRAKCTEHGDIWILKSPFFTYAAFCSPCAPGACYLLDRLDAPEADNKCYCLGPEFFKDNKPPYDIYSIETGEIIAKSET